MTLAKKAVKPNRKIAVPQLRIGFLVHDVSRMRKTLYDQALKPLGITRAQWWVLANLSRQEEEGTIQSDLARLLEVGKVTIGGIIDRLEESGQVVRESSTQDRRVKRVFITEQGHDVLEQMADVGRELNNQILASLAPGDIHLAEEVLHVMKDNLREMLIAHDLDTEEVASSIEPAAPAKSGGSTIVSPRSRKGTAGKSGRRSSTTAKPALLA